MKNIYLFALLCLCFSCKSQKSVLFEARLDGGQEPGGCYFSYIDDRSGEKEGPFILEITPPKFQEVRKRFSMDELKNHKTDSSYYQFEIKNAHVKYVFHDKDISDFTTVKKPVGYIFCLAVRDSQFRTLTINELIDRDYIVVYYEMIEPSRIIRHEARSNPIKLKGNQLYFPAGKWSDLKPVVYGSH